MPHHDLPKVTVIQDGARRHYAVPVALQSVNMLDRVYTNWYASPGSIDSWIAKGIRMGGGRMGDKLAQRYSPLLDASRVVSSPWNTLRAQWGRRRFSAEADFFRWESEEFAKWVIRHGFGKADTLFGFVRNMHPMLAAAAQQKGLKTIGDQMIAPYKIEDREDELQRQRFPQFSSAATNVAEDFSEFESQTWASLDHITCGSDYVKQGLVQCGVEFSKISVIPYPMDAAKFPFVHRPQNRTPITVGFVGSIGLRKGAPYFIEVARKLASEKMRFVMVGKIHLSERAASNVSSVEFIGSVSRAEVLQWMSQFDIFFFPSTCEGSAGVVREAMATGLPVVCSPNSGIVQLEPDSCILREYDDIEGAASAIVGLAESQDLRTEMGRRARRNSELASIEYYAREIARETRQLHLARVSH